MKDGIYFGMPDHEYRSIDAYGSTVIKTAASLSVKHARTKRPDSFALSRGRLIHTVVLEPDEMAKRYAKQPSGHGGSKAVKDAKKAIKESGLEAVAPSDWLAAERCGRSVMEHPVAGPIFSSGEPEVTVVWTHESGAKLKARIDWLDTEKLIAVDLKSCGMPGAVHPGKFLREVLRYKYAAQAVHYMSGLEAITGEAYSWRLVAVEAQPPFAVTVFDLGPKLWREGIELWETGVARLFEADEIEENTTWPARLYTLDVR